MRLRCLLRPLKALCVELLLAPRGLAFKTSAVVCSPCVCCCCCSCPVCHPADTKWPPKALIVLIVRVCVFVCVCVCVCVCVFVFIRLTCVRVRGPRRGRGCR